jgi:hypothetical protein
MKKFADEICRENQNPQFMFNNPTENRAVYAIIWGKNSTSGQMAIRRKRIACYTTTAIDTHSEYVIPDALPRQR